MEPTTFDYEAFWFGIIVGALGFFLFIRLACMVDDWIQRHVERKIQKQIDERAERMKRLIIEDTIKQLEDHANWQDEE